MADVSVERESPGTYRGTCKPTWCRGCGDYAVLSSLDRALKDFGVPAHDISIVSGIGCSSRFPYFLETYGIHSAHGRALPVAIGLKVAHPEKTVIVTGGDGDAFSIGGNHFLHAMRRNVDLTYLIMDNQIYGMTKGQTSPTSFQNTVTKSSPYGSLERPLNPVWLALTAGATFVAQAAFHHVKLLYPLISAGLRHKGTAVIIILSRCITYNRDEDKDFYEAHSARLPEGYDPTDYGAAIEFARSNFGRFPIGLIYQNTQQPTLEAGLAGIERKAQARGAATLQDLVAEFL